MKTMLAVAACRFTRRIMHAMGRGGTALPGKIAARIDKNILSRTSRGMHIILVTGTNGKTTTSRILANACELGGKSCLLNRSGANLLSGITAEFVCSADHRGRPRQEYAVVECDEGALKQVVPRVKPEAIVVTNLFRDQLDRYGEVMNTRSQLLEGIRLAPRSILCLNADCSLTASLSDGLPNRVLRFGLDVPAGEQEEKELSDAKYCIRCGTEYDYSYHTYAHLGGFRCPKCGYCRQEPDTAVTAVSDLSSAQPDIRIRIGEKEYETHAALPAVYNIYNAAAAVCGGSALGLPAEMLLEAVARTDASFGRMETFVIGGVRLQMILVKNPAGCDQTIDYITGGKEEYDIAFCLNDRTADGHDISWIWDADFEKIVRDPHMGAVYVSGIRAEDMQLRLKYAGIAETRVVLEKDPAKLLGYLRQSGKKVYIMPNYTAMLDMRKTLQPLSDRGEFWKG